jgi:hypothetical protein
MTGSAWQTARLDDLDRLGPNDEGTVWRPIRRRFGVEAFGVNAWPGPQPGDRACFESVAGDADAAFDSLRRAVELNGDEVRRIAPDDPDFDPIRADPRYQEVIA